MYTLIAIIFIAELIIAYQILSVILKFDRKVCELNSVINEFNPLTKTFMRYIRMQVVSVSEKVGKTIAFINEQKKKAIVKILFIIGINTMFILLNIKRLKSHKVTNLAIALLDLAFDLKVL